MALVLEHVKMPETCDYYFIIVLVIIFNHTSFSCIEKILLKNDGFRSVSFTIVTHIRFERTRVDLPLTQENYVFFSEEMRAKTLFLVNKTISKINNDKLILKTCYFLDSTLLNVPDI